MEVGHIKNSNKLFYIDARELERAVQRAMKRAIIRIRENIYNRAVANIEAIDFKDNEVRMEDGSVTSDSERKKALIASINYKNPDGSGGNVQTQVERTYGRVVKSVITGYINAMGENFKDSHIGWYYEVGTGEESDVQGYTKYGLPETLGDRNPYRVPGVGSAIVSRYKGDGTWVDFGGNLRATGSPVGGVGSAVPPAGLSEVSPKSYKEMKDRFREYIGDDIKAHYWFDRAVSEGQSDIIDICIEEINNEDIMNPENKVFVVPKKIRITGKGRRIVERY